MPHKLYVHSWSPALDGAKYFRNRGDTTGEQACLRIHAQPKCHWLGDWTPDPRKEISSRTQLAVQQIARPLFALYNIMGRDGDAYSAGGVSSRDEYLDWVDLITAGFRDTLTALQLGGSFPVEIRPIVILEPDGLSVVNHLDRDEFALRINTLSKTVNKLKSTGVTVYIDAGCHNWIPPQTMAQRLDLCNIKQADGFSINNAHFETTTNSIAYANAVNSFLPQREGYVIDTGRNGTGPSKVRRSDGDPEWCNPPDVALGQNPTLDPVALAAYPNNNLCRGLLWCKGPGESDGQGEKGTDPPPGKFWPEYAKGLVQRSPFAG